MSNGPSLSDAYFHGPASHCVLACPVHADHLNSLLCADPLDPTLPDIADRALPTPRRYVHRLDSAWHDAPLSEEPDEGSSEDDDTGKSIGSRSKHFGSSVAWEASAPER